MGRVTGRERAGGGLDVYIPMGCASSDRLESLRGSGAPKPEISPNSIFQSLSNLTSGGHTGSLYSDLERFWDAFGFVLNRFLKKFFFSSTFFPFFF